MTEQRHDDKQMPSSLYVWIVPSASVQEQPGSWRIRKWDTEPFPEATHVCAPSAVQESEYRQVASVCYAMASDGKCGPVAWFESMHTVPDGTPIYIKNAAAQVGRDDHREAGSKHSVEPASAASSIAPREPDTIEIPYRAELIFNNETRTVTGTFTVSATQRREG